MKVLANRYNPASLINFATSKGSSISYGKRWQVSLETCSGEHKDYFFVAKPTRKQVRKLHNI